MRAMILSGLATFLAVLNLPAGAQPPAPDKAAAKQIAAIRKILDEARIDTEPFQKEMPLTQFLKALEKRLPEGKKVSLRIDAEAFGDRFAAVAQTPVRLPPFPRKMAVWTALRIALSKVEGKATFRTYPTHFAITTPERAAYESVHDFADLARHAKFLHSRVQQIEALGVTGGDDLRDVEPGGISALVVRLVLTLVEPENGGAGQPAANMQVRNGTRLVVRATEDTHDRIANLLDALRRLADVAVVMNARLYEVDRAFYAKHIAPLLADPKAPAGPRLVSVSEALVKQLAKQRLVLEGESVKLRPREQTRFLSLQTPYRYLARFGAPLVGGLEEKMERVPVYRTGLAGVSFLADPVVSADRRYVRLKVTQEVAQLVEIKRAKVPDPRTGKDVEVESPNVREASLTTTLDIHDGQTILMPVAYRPPGAAGKDRLWVLVARPVIYIEEEEEQIRKGK